VDVPLHANGMREASQIADWTAKVLKPATVGIMYLNVSEDIAAKDVAIKQLQKAGIKSSRAWPRSGTRPTSRSTSWPCGRPTPTSSVVLMAGAGAKFMHDASTQHWQPKLGFAANHLTGGPRLRPHLR